MATKLLLGFIHFLLVTSTAIGDIIVLSTGEQLTVTVLEQNENNTKVHHAILGDFTVDAGEIVSVEYDEDSKNLPSLVNEEPPVSNTNEPAPWNQAINVALGLQNGQKDSTNIFTSYQADRTIDEHKVIVDISYRVAESDGARTENRFSSKWGNTWFQSDSKWDVFTNLQFDWSEFQSWDKRIIGDIGVGYELINTLEGDEAFTLTISVGSGFRKEFNSSNESIIPEGLFGTKAQWNISKKQKLSAETTWYPDYADFENYRLVTKAIWNIQLDAVENLQFSVGLLHEYDSVVDAGVEKTNLRITAGIKYAF